MTGWPAGKWPTAKCRTCGATIIWAETENEKKMPLDAEPREEGRFDLLRGDGYPHKSGRLMPPGSILAVWNPNVAGPRYGSHFETCPQASGHRRKR